MEISFINHNTCWTATDKIEYTKVRNFTQRVLIIRYVKATGTPLQCMLSKH